MFEKPEIQHGDEPAPIRVRNRAEQVDLSASRGELIPKLFPWLQFNLPHIFNENIHERIEEVYESTRATLAERGQPNAHLGKLYWQPYIPGGTLRNFTNVETVVVTSITSPEHPDVAELAMLKLLAHELYHSSAVLQVDIDERKPDAVVYKNVVAGATSGFGHRGSSHGPYLALEEGLATLHEVRTLQMLLEEAPHEVREMYERYMEQARAIIAREHAPEQQAATDAREEYERVLADNTAVIDLLVIEGDTVRGALYEPAYVQAKALVEFLAQEIPEFYALVEKARMQRRTLPLARALEERFGRGAYAEVTTASLSQAQEVLEHLRELK